MPGVGKVTTVPVAIAHSAKYVRPTSACVIATLLTAAILGCDAEARPSSDAASVSDTSAVNATARTFLSTLNEKQRATASFPFDDPERTKWAYVPQSRNGLAFKEMNPEQRAAAFGLVGTGLSDRGTKLAHGVIELEGILGQLEGFPWIPRRDPGAYYMSLFSRPGAKHPWGWRFEGHHISVNVTDLGPQGQIVAPLFMGANPARVPSGPKAGFQLLKAEEDAAFALLNKLDPQQRARATISAQPLGNITSGTDPAVASMPLAGLPAAEMTLDQQQQLRRLLGVFAGWMSDSSAKSQLGRIDAAGFEKLHFAWAGAHQPREGHYFRIHGPTVLVEYDNSSSNHIHSVWRDLENDFGGDLLRKHYAQQPHRP
jgi:hypothetical protein